jgi:GTPase Era involved in 16S rRNA processing
MSPRPTVSAAGFDDVLADLELAIPGEKLLREMREQWKAQQVRVVVLGEAKRGKSSLINAMAGRSILPTGVIPVTSVVTVVRADPAESARVTYVDGREDCVGLDKIVDYVTEEHNAGNRRGVQSVEVLVTNVPWPESVVFVDTPGTGSVEENHDVESSAAARAMDVALVVLTSDPPVSAREREQIAVATEQAAELLVIVAKSDLMTSVELETVVGYTREVASQAAGHDVEVITVSAKDPSAEPHPGLVRIRDVITSLATDPERHTLLRSLRDRTRRLVQAVQDEVELTRSLTKLDSDEATGRERAFTAALEETRAQSRGCAELVSAGVRSINTQLDKSAAAAAGVLSEKLAGRVEEFASLGGDDRAAEALAVDEMTRLVTEYAERWRQASAAEAEEELEQLSRRATGVTGTAVTELRDAAQELLGVRLNIAIEPISLPENVRFFFVQTTLADAASALSGLVRHHLPRRIRRRSVSAYLRETAPLLADRQLGRARGDLRLRLADAERSLIGQVETGMCELLDRLESAATAAAGVAGEQSELSDTRLRVLAERRELLAKAMRRLDELVEERP